ncbi:MAG: hypothetical protein KTR14_06820 [Vampirovibrio sp.]|nr:hypothetical protein [Vampirovibrio sp.]
MSREEKPQSGQASGYPEDDPDFCRMYDRRYRSSKFFLEDQLRCSEAVNDFKTVKNFMQRTPQFGIKPAFQFALSPAKSD